MTPIPTPTDRWSLPEGWAGQLLARPSGDLAVVDHDVAWTTADLLAAAASLAAWLESLGARAGQPVPALVRSSPQALALVVAGILAGRPVAPLGPQLTPGELAACLASGGGSVLVADEDLVPLATELAGSRIIGVLSPGGRGPGPQLDGERSSRKTAVVLHTSGTGGTPKRVFVGQGPLAARTAVVAELLSLGPGDRYVTAKGIHHIGGLGLTLAALAAGAAVVPLGRYSPDAWAGLAPLAPTHGSVVPTMVEDMLGAGQLHLPSMRLLQYGGAPIHPDTLVALLASEPDLEVVALYGQTEGSPLASLRADDHRLAVTSRPELLASAGRAAPGVELRIVDGEVLARAEHLFRTSDDGWLRTGDLGRIDGDGYLFLSGRAGDVIVRGGENVHPVEVEQVLAAHPGVRDVAVAAVDDRRLGQAVGAWIVPEGEPPPTDELHAWVRERLAGFKVPSVWMFLDALPRNPNGKVLRRELPPPR